MLQSLQIRNLALVDALQVDFAPGLNVITGETGAGKSIIIGALALLLGARASRDIIRDGAEQCVLEAEFVLARPEEVNAVLNELGVSCCQDGHLVVRRIIQPNGNGRQFVNDASVTLQTMKKVGDLLVDLHGSHEHQSLLNADFQLQLLDACGALEEQRQDYRQAYMAWQEMLAARDALTNSGQDLARECDWLIHQIQEIEAADLKADEEEAITREHLWQGNAQRLGQLFDAVQQALVGSESSALNALAAVQTSLAELERLDQRAGAWKNEIKAVARQLQDFALMLDSHLQQVETDPARLQWLDERLACYRRIKRKYGDDIKAVLTHLETSRQRLHELQSREERLAELDKKIAGARAQVTALGLKLRQKRQAAGRQLARLAQKELRDLGMPEAAFFMAMTEQEPVSNGMDRVEFGFAPNPGEPQRSLRAIASSGEISRVMLALKTVLAEHDQIPVLVFDEVDANLGGKMGQVIGLKLASIARRRQVLCITHLPQVAVFGQTQYAVSKGVQNGRTVTGISRLSSERRLDEIARMLGGADFTSVTVKHAREMLKNARNMG